MIKDKNKLDTFTDAISNRLLNSDIISSEDTGIEEKFAKAKAGIEKGQEASTSRIESEFGRKIGIAKETGARTITTAQEAQRGFATNTAMMRQLREETERTVKDLEQRKQELLLAGEAASAEKISNIQIQELQFEQTQKQQIFQNLLALGSFGIQQQAGQRAEKAFGLQERGMDFAETQAKSKIALEYGVAVEPGDTLTDIINRVKPFASAKRQKEMDLADAQLANLRAQTQKALSDVKADDIDINQLAAAGLLNPSILATIKNPNVAAKVTNKIAELQKTDLKSTILKDIQSGTSREESIKSMFNNPNILDKISVAKMINELYQKFDSKSVEKEQATLRKSLETVGGGILESGQDVFRFVTGSEAKGIDLLRFFIGVPSIPH